MIDVQPDPKPERRKGNAPRRIVDPVAIRMKMATELECRAGCGRRADSAHHLIQKGAPHFGDDVMGNIVGVCGHGTAGCHGAIHGNPYVDQDGERWTTERVAAAIGETLTAPEIAYFLQKLGRDAGIEFLARHYHRRLV